MKGNEGFRRLDKVQSCPDLNYRNFVGCLLLTIRVVFSTIRNLLHVDRVVVSSFERISLHKGFKHTTLFSKKHRKF